MSVLKLTSPAFEHQEPIPPKYVAPNCGGGENASPPLEWLGLPDGSKSLVVLVEDPDAPRGSFTHWVAYDIPTDRDSLNEAAAGGNGGGRFRQGRNSLGHAHYDGPCPPQGETHRYFFYLYALDVPELGLGEGATAGQVRDAIKGHVIAQAELIGRYGR